MSNEYSQKEISELVSIRNSIQSLCRKCGGEGHLILGGLSKGRGGGGAAATWGRCECLHRFNYVSELYYSKIPREYWSISVKDSKVDKQYKQIFKHYVNNIETAIEDGLGMILSSPQRGIGKTTSMCIIGKYAIQKGYKVFYTIAQNIIDDRWTDDHKVLDRIYECDLLLIDELDKIIMAAQSNIPKQLENLLRGILPNRKATIICTNFTESEIEHKFKIVSLLKRYTNIIPMEGEDYSDELQKKWFNRLERKDFDYNSDVLKKETQTFIKNMGEGNEGQG